MRSCSNGWRVAGRGSESRSVFCFLTPTITRLQGSVAYKLPLSKIRLGNPSLYNRKDPYILKTVSLERRFTWLSSPPNNLSRLAPGVRCRLSVVRCKGSAGLRDDQPIDNGSRPSLIATAPLRLPAMPGIATNSTSTCGTPRLAQVIVEASAANQFWYRGKYRPSPYQSSVTPDCPELLSATGNAVPVEGELLQRLVAVCQKNEVLKVGGCDFEPEGFCDR